MKKIISTLFFVLLLSSQWCVAQYTDVINSNRPGLSMSAFSVGKSVFQLESGIYGIREDHNLLRYNYNGFGIDFDARYGVWKEELEIVANFKFQYDQYYSPLIEDQRSGFRTTTIGAKYLIYDPFKNYEEKPNLYSWKANNKFKWRQFIPAVSVYAGANFGFANTDYAFPDEPSFSPKIMVIAQNHFGGHWVLVTNIFYDKFTTDYKSLGYILTLTRGFNEKWSGFIENQGIDGDYYSDGIFRVGAAYLFQPNFQIDASISKNYKDTPDILYGGVGVSWRFDKKYQPVKIEKEESGGKRAGNKKTKSKKRLDQIEG
ncbi:transporter [Flavobacterium sp.]|jgi:hypothetical protein|uniref:transporter n=1 Tax=Flavobacterium sp. TaxID=239 RepID=UPI002FDB0F5F